jgi:branched-chain amino acid transport system permease protein
MWRPCGIFDDTYAKDMAIIRTPQQWALTVAALAILAILPAFVSMRMLTTINLLAISVVAALGLNVLVGMTGQISLGQAGFMAVGAYTATLLCKYQGFSFWVALPCAALASGLIGLLFGLPSLRIKGFYLAMATLAAQFIIPWVIVNGWPSVTGGTSTITVPAPKIAGLVLRSQGQIYYVCVPVAVAALFFTRNLARSKIGRAFVAIRDNDLAAEVMGIEVFRYKLLSFFICTFYAGVAGALWAIWMRAINVDHFTLHESIWYLGMIIIGGLGSVPGTVFGVIVIRVLDLLVKYIGPGIRGYFPEAVGAAIQVGLGPLCFGLAILFFLLFEPRGLAHRWNIFKAFYRLWPFSY